MQIRGLHRSIYRGARLASRLETKERSDVVERRDASARWQQARRDGLDAKAAAKAVGKPLSTLYRWQKQPAPKSTRPHNVRKPRRDPKLVLATERLRKQYPMWGKDTLAPLLWREGFDVSVSMVGRILKSLVERGLVEPVPQLRKGSRHAPRKHKRTYATRLPKGKKPDKPGQIVQLDTVHIGLVPGKTIRHFTAYCPVAKWTVAKAYNRATAAAAALFLDKLQADMPFTVEGIQVDGGSEFMAEFEEACRQRGIRLFVLPPRSPKLNGHVERAQRTHKDEFYYRLASVTTLAQINKLLRRWEDIHNTYRPHQALGQITPLAFLEKCA